MVVSALGSLVFDIEVALTEDKTTHGDVRPQARVEHLLIQRLEALSRPACPFARELLFHVQRICSGAVGQDIPDVQALAAELASLGYYVTVRSALQGNGTDCFRSLRHEFVLVRGSGEFSGMEFIVEPALRQHFAIPHPSPEYSAALSHVSEVFVGGSCRLVPVVQLLCALMADSFERQGLALPPWRKEQAMLSKWLPLPHRLRDRQVTPPPQAAAAAKCGIVTEAAAQSAFDAAIETVDSAASNTSTDSGDGWSSGSMDCSPVSVLPPPPRQGDSAATVSTKFFAVHGFQPLLTSTAVAATAIGGASGGGDEDMPALTAAAAAQGCPGVMRGRGGGCGGGCGNCLKRAFGYDSCMDMNGLCGGIGGGSGDGSDCGGNGKHGLLAARIAESARTVAANGDGDGSGDGGVHDRIRTRPPVHLGEMAIRVVKLVGFNLPEESQPQQQQQQQQRQHTAHVVQNQPPPVSQVLQQQRQQPQHSRRNLQAPPPPLDLGFQRHTRNAAAAAAAEALLLPWRRQLRHRAV
ncbi:hypothetical protein Agub_g6303 [Astrephomene gubernaculifera]|uniref:Uncharacterized protein n=1 Tax=Astrephomene gubernaculifera TaxID=47775 RepID=A0AAD3DPS4_9CHLO|nr:hypothetical protein Agub_g6303 [Astrephomene gubernaculifera]